jgi:hypothetical protein
MEESSSHFMEDQQRAWWQEQVFFSCFQFGQSVNTTTNYSTEQGCNLQYPQMFHFTGFHGLCCEGLCQAVWRDIVTCWYHSGFFESDVLNFKQSVQYWVNKTNMQTTNYSLFISNCDTDNSDLWCCNFRTRQVDDFTCSLLQIHIKMLLIKNEEVVL